MSPVGVALLAGAAAGVLRAWAVWRRGRDLRRLADAHLLRRFARLPGGGRALLRGAAVAAGAAAIAAGLVLGGGGASTGEAELETVLVLDASNSMLARDVRPSRLARQRELARRVAADLPGRVGVVYFAGRGYVLTPLTPDRDAVHMLIDAVRPAAVGRGGSAPAAGLQQALEVLAGGGGDAPRAVVFFSDGEATVDEVWDDAVDAARAGDVRVHAVGIGTARGGPIPLGREAALDPAAALEARSGEPFLRGPDGEVVRTRLEEEALRQVARRTGGIYVTAEAEGGAASVVAAVSGGGRPAGAPAGSGVLLLLAAFGVLWAEAFLAAGPARRRPGGSRGATGRAVRVATVVALGLAGLGAGRAGVESEPGAPGLADVARSQQDRAGPGPQDPELARFREAFERSGQPVDAYNLGTALLRAEGGEEAVALLEEASAAGEPSVAVDARYNLGLARAREGRDAVAAEARREALLSAREAFRGVLRATPSAEDARWNLELVERWLEEEARSGGGGAAAGPAPSPAGTGAGAPQGAGEGEVPRLGPAEAATLLERAGRAEAAVRDRALGRARLRDPAVARNW